MEDFAAVYTRYRHAVHAYLFTLCQNEDLAEELTQETFFKALRALDSFDGRCPLNVWLCRIAKNTLYIYTRKHKREAPPAQTVFPPRIIPSVWDTVFGSIRYSLNSATA